MFEPVTINSSTLRGGHYRLPPASRIVLEEIPGKTKKSQHKIVQTEVKTVVEIQNLSQQNIEIIMIEGSEPKHYALTAGGVLTVPYSDLSTSTRNLISRGMLQVIYK